MPKAPKANHATGLITINRVVKTPAQTAWLAERLPEFAAAQTEGKLSEFWPKIQEQYLAAFPVPGMDNDSLPQEEREKVAKAVQRVREVSLILKLRSRSIIYIWIYFNRASIGGSTTKAATASAVWEILLSRSTLTFSPALAILLFPRILVLIPHRTVPLIMKTTAVVTPKCLRRRKGRQAKESVRTNSPKFSNRNTSTPTATSSKVPSLPRRVLTVRSPKVSEWKFALVCAQRNGLWQAPKSRTVLRLCRLQSGQRSRRVKLLSLRWMRLQRRNSQVKTWKRKSVYLPLPLLYHSSYSTDLSWLFLILLGNLLRTLASGLILLWRLSPQCETPKCESSKPGRESPLFYPSAVLNNVLFSSAHHGSNASGLTFVDAYPKFTETFMVPFTTFARRVICKFTSASVWIKVINLQQKQKTLLPQARLALPLCKHPPVYRKEMLPSPARYLSIKPQFLRIHLLQPTWLFPKLPSVLDLLVRQTYRRQALHLAMLPAASHPLCLTVAHRPRPLVGTLQPRHFYPADSYHDTPELSG